MPMLGDGMELKLGGTSLKNVSAQINGNFRTIEIVEAISFGDTGGITKLASTMYDPGALQVEVDCDYTTLKTLQALQTTQGAAGVPFELIYPLTGNTPAKITGTAFISDLPANWTPRQLARAAFRLVLTGDLVFVDPT